MANPPASQRQHLTSVDGIPGYWATKTGAETTAETSKVWDGGQIKPVVLSSPKDTANIVVGRPYYPEQHAALRRQYARLVGRFRTTVKVQDTDPDLVPIQGALATYPDALLVRVSAGDGDAGSSDARVWEMEFAVAEEA